eukprot:5738774-Prymnesium_polylepis.1
MPSQSMMGLPSGSRPDLHSKHGSKDPWCWASVSAASSNVGAPARYARPEPVLLLAAGHPSGLQPACHAYQCFCTPAAHLFLPCGSL